ncbi:MAG: chemotaxis protein CheW [Actinomycetota bacterium]
MTDYEDEIIQEFLVESAEMLDSLDAAFVTLEEDPSDTAELSAVFRSMHTIKGTCGFLGFGNLETLAHKGENLLSMLRDGVMILDSELTDALLATVDQIRVCLDQIAATMSDEGVDNSALVATLIALAEKHDPDRTPAAEDTDQPATDAEDAGDAADPEVKAVAPGVVLFDQPIEDGPELPETEDTPDPAAHSDDDSADKPPADEAPEEAAADDEAEATVDPVAGEQAAEQPAAPVEATAPVAPQPPKRPQRPRIGDVLVEDHNINRVDVEIAAAEQQLGDERKIGEILTDSGTTSPAVVDEALTTQKASGVKSDTTIRVDVALLDDLMNLVGELVLARNEILQHVGRNEDAEFAASSQRLNIITSDLQERVMKTRMQPIASLWSKLPRVVRDLAQQCDKQVRLEMEGKETELDKSLLEAIKDPITHIVRNTVDHGIEDPDRREELGKQREGVLRLSASHEGGQVNIEITDDGGGIDLDRIRAKAVEKGLIQAKVAESMSDTDAVDLIFMPGFSTAAAVTNVSGRGVGMDVVRTNIEKIGGSVEVRTERGQGTTFKMKIPLTLAIVPALVIEVHKKRYAIPQTGLVELLTIGSKDGRSIEFIHGAPVLRVRDRLVPIVDLRSVLHPGTDTEWTGDVVILTADDRTFGVLVDDIVETQEIVVKPLGNVVADVRLFSGATILGDGKVALILDVLGVAHDAGVLSGTPEVSHHLTDSEEQLHHSPEGLSTLLLLRVGDSQVGMDLSDVARLEEFKGDQIEQSGHRSVIQYRDTIMPLVDLAQELGYGSCDRSGSVSVVVYAIGGRDIGLMIGDVLDIVDVAITDPSGCVVARGNVTELIRPGDLPSVQALDNSYDLLGVS